MELAALYPSQHI